MEKLNFAIEENIHLFDFSLLKRKLHRLRISQTTLSKYISDPNGGNYKLSTSSVQAILSNHHLPREDRKTKTFAAASFQHVKNAAERLIAKAEEPLLPKATMAKKESHEAIAV